MRGTITRHLRDPLGFYFVFTAILYVLTYAAMSALGISGFSLSPYLNAALALAVFAYGAQFVLVGILEGAERYHKIDRRSFVYVASLVCVASVGLILGVSQSHSDIYIISTTVYFVNYIIFCLMATRMKITDGHIQSLILPAAVVCLMGRFWGQSIAPHALLFLGIASLIGVSRPGGRKTVSIVGFLSLMVIIGASNRAVLIALLLSAIACALIYRRYFVSFMLCVTALGAPIVLSSISLDLYLDSNGGSYRRAKEIQLLMNGERSFDEIVALQQRLFEMDLVSDLMENESLGVRLFGGGFGKTINMTASGDGSVIEASFLGSGHVHNIHSLPHAVYFRYGWLGLILFSLFSINVIRNVVVGIGVGRLGFMVSFCILYPLARLVTAIPASNFLIVDFIVFALVIRANHGLSCAKRA